eukprot:12666543-Heterocapsa_arctica.AAC.1
MEHQPQAGPDQPSWRLSPPPHLSLPCHHTPCCPLRSPPLVRLDRPRSHAMAPPSRQRLPPPHRPPRL